MEGMVATSRIAAIGGVALFLAAAESALACPPMQHEVCIPLTGTCFCSVNVTVGLISPQGETEVAPPFDRSGIASSETSNGATGVVQMCYFPKSTLSEVEQQTTDKCIWFEVNSNTAQQ
jgi:hypothetical protein